VPVTELGRIAAAGTLPQCRLAANSDGCRFSSGERRQHISFLPSPSTRSLRILLSLEIDAYETLRRAKRGPRESFSSVIRRAHWEDMPPNAAGLLDDLRSLCGQHPEVLLSESTLRGLERRRRTARRKSGWQR